jgi:hypothetical protein
MSGIYGVSVAWSSRAFAHGLMSAWKEPLNALQNKAFFNTMDWWGICLNGPLPLPHHWGKNIAYFPKASALGPVLSNIEKKFKNKICWRAYLNLCCVWMFSMQFITNFTIKTLFWEAEIFFKMCTQNAGNSISETQILKISWGGAPRPPIVNSCLRYSAYTSRDRILSLGEGKESGPFGSFAPPLKNP